MNKALVLALGTFDGLHLGHRALISRCLELARELGLGSACYTFRNVPAAFSLGLSNIQLMSASHKEDLLRQLGLDLIIMEDFNEKLMNTEPEDFVKGLLFHFDIGLMVVGKDFRFGRGGQGTSQILKNLGLKYGYETEIIDFIYDEEGKLSSSRLRARLREGDMEATRHILGRNFSFRAAITMKAGSHEKFWPLYTMRPDFDIAPIKQGAYRVLLKSGAFKEALEAGLVASAPPSMWELEFSYGGPLELGSNVYELEFIEALDEG